MNDHFLWSILFILIKFVGMDVFCGDGVKRAWRPENATSPPELLPLFTQQPPRSMVEGHHMIETKQSLTFPQLREVRANVSLSFIKF
jgi:hypothetical protein